MNLRWYNSGTVNLLECIQANCSACASVMGNRPSTSTPFFLFSGESLFMPWRHGSFRWGLGFVFHGTFFIGGLGVSRWPGHGFRILKFVGFVLSQMVVPDGNALNIVKTARRGFDFLEFHLEDLKSKESRVQK